MLGGFVGARGFHIFIEQPHFLLGAPEFLFLRFGDGGFVYYGGAIVGTLCAWWVCRLKNYNFWAMGDLMAPVLAGGYAVGRLGCLGGGLLLRRTDDDASGGIHFPSERRGPLRYFAAADANLFVTLGISRYVLAPLSRKTCPRDRKSRAFQRPRSTFRALGLPSTASEERSSNNFEMTFGARASLI